MGSCRLWAASVSELTGWSCSIWVVRGAGAAHDSAISEWPVLVGVCFRLCASTPGGRGTVPEIRFNLRADNECQCKIEARNIHIVELPDGASDTLAPNRHRLVSNHLRSNPQPVCLGAIPSSLVHVVARASLAYDQLPRPGRNPRASAAATPEVVLHSRHCRNRLTVLGDDGGALSFAASGF